MKVDANDIARSDGVSALRDFIDGPSQGDKMKPDEKVVDLDNFRPPEYSDEALALRFAERYAGRLCYVAAWSRWLIWDDVRWQFDQTYYAFDLARRVCRQASAECRMERLARSIAGAQTVAAVERLAKADRRLAATVDQWDADPWLLNTPAGVVDLRTGKMRPHRPEDYMTKMTAVAPDASHSIKGWLQFLRRISGGDQELIDYFRRVSGYALTGTTQEQALFFGYGTGGNGKGVFISTISSIFGDYHRVAPIETFTESHGERHPTDLAGLRGARLVTAIETEEGRHWAESRIKSLTGGDKIAARLMRQDFFEFFPQFKLLIAGNHKPRLRSVDEAIRRRLNLIPFSVTIPPNERDNTLTEKLKAEWPGVLAWMIEGCLEWQRVSLLPPKVVTSATEAYLEGEDVFADWIEECCELDPTAWERSIVLFGSWTEWAERSGESKGDSKRFRERLETRGIDHKREGGTGRTGYQGLRLRPAWS